MTPHWSDALVRLGACDPAVEWAATQPDLATAWRVCHRGDWMVWIWMMVVGGEPMSEGRKPVIACLCDIVEEIGRPTDHASIAALALLRRWIGGEAVSIAEMLSAADAAHALARAAAHALARAAAYAADAAADAAYAADIVRRHAPAPPFTLGDAFRTGPGQGESFSHAGGELEEQP